MAGRVKKTDKPLAENNLFMLIISVVSAFILWIVLSLTAFPETTVVLREVPIDYSLDGSYADVTGISVLDMSDTTANVRINGQRYLIGDYSNDDIHIGINLDTVRAPGVYDLPLVVTSTNGDAIDVDTIEPSTVKVEFDYMITKSFSVADGTLTADISNISAADGYIVDPAEVIIEPSVVEIYGPRDYVNQVTSCEVKVQSGATVMTTLQTSNTSVTLYNGENIVNDSKISVQSENGFALTIPVYMRKDMKLDVEIQTYFDQFDISSLKYTINPSEITVRSQSDRISNIDEITLGYVDLRSLDIRSNIILPINNTDYYTNISGYDTATVTFDFENYSTKTLTINNSQIYPINVPNGYQVDVETDRINNIKVIGPSEIIEQIDSKDLIAQIDMLDYNITEGFRMYTVTVYLPMYNNCWCCGTYQVACNVQQVDDNQTVQRNDDGNAADNQ
ncbi:MAG TPA: hypothetical protein IAC39_07265 [Candidatus Faeciplasma pullistercoris]|uniref:YbbR-like protein n=1 Tax=Candidatus Faeciplasma pullistercoris TaxID=2840800 RepID=A0A9D1GWB8_9FIRM|nr:hypothetical protein [Candidatus Faeciplasma pullistercoris]